MRCLVLACLLTFAAASTAAAQPAPAPEPPVCTTVTTVVKKGDVVLSTSSKTTCEAPKGEGGHGGGVLKAPEAVLAAPAVALGSVLGGSQEMKVRQVRGEWKTVLPGSSRVCHLMLLQETTDLGRGVRATDCAAPLSRAAAWKLEDNAVTLYGKDGALIVRLTGDPSRLSGAGVTLER
jgi:hypothetical protein